MPTPGRGMTYWSDARAVLEIRGRGPAVTVALDRPFGLVGRLADAEVRIDDHDAGSRHAYLHADARGLFVVDLATRTGTRFGEVRAPAGWLRVGESFEVAGRTIRLAAFEVDGRPANPPPCADDLMADSGDAPLVGLVLEPAGPRGPSWAIGSELSFAGRGDACGVRLNQADVSRMHCALLRTATAAYLIDLPGGPTLVNDAPPRGAVALRDGDTIRIGRARFIAHITLIDSNGHVQPLGIHAPSQVIGRALTLAPRAATPDLAALPTFDGRPFPIDLVPPEARGAVVAWMLGALHAGQAEILRRQDALQAAMDQILRQLAETTTPPHDLPRQQIESLAAEVARLDDRARAAALVVPPSIDPPASFAAAVAPAPEIDPARSLATAAWLLDRIDRVGNENKFSLRSLFSRLFPRPAPPSLFLDPATGQPSTQSMGDDPGEGERA